MALAIGMVHAYRVRCSNKHRHRKLYVVEVEGCAHKFVCTLAQKNRKEASMVAVEKGHMEEEHAA